MTVGELIGNVAVTVVMVALTKHEQPELTAEGDPLQFPR
jgi:hypothetical protein